MKIAFKFIALGVVLAASSVLAHASPLSAGTLTIDGSVGALNPPTLNASTTSISTSGTIFTFGSTGTSFSSISLFTPVTFSNLFTFTVGGASIGGEQLFSFTFNGGTESFDVSQVFVAPNGSLLFYGILSDGIVGDNTNGTYILTPNASGEGSFSSTLTATPTPEPSSLILLGTGLIGAAGLMFRKRRAVV